MESYTCEPLSLDQIENIYHIWLKHDFPRNELKPFSMIRKAYARHEYACYGLFVDHTISGYAYLVQQLHGGKVSYLLDYFAITPGDRGQGYGGIFLQLLTERLSGADWLLCEAESPDAAQNAAERSLRQRRIAFYLRGGLVETGVTARVFGVEYVILELPRTILHTPEAVRQAYSSFYRNMLPAILYRCCIAARTTNPDTKVEATIS